MSRSDIVVEPISARITLKRPATLEAAAATFWFVKHGARSACSATADMMAIKCDLPVP
jgi:hypothetical protein